MCFERSIKLYHRTFQSKGVRNLSILSQLAKVYVVAQFITETIK